MYTKRLRKHNQPNKEEKVLLSTSSFRKEVVSLFCGFCTNIILWAYHKLPNFDFICKHLAKCHNKVQNY